MSKGSQTRPESDPGAFRRGWDRIRWPEPSRDVVFDGLDTPLLREECARLIRERAINFKPGTLMDVFMREPNA